MRRLCNVLQCNVYYFIVNTHVAAQDLHTFMYKGHI